MSIDEEHYGMAKVYRYEMKGKHIFHIYRPLSSCVYCELYYEDGSRLNQEELKYFAENKNDPLIIWENRPPVPIDSLIRNNKVNKKEY